MYPLDSKIHISGCRYEKILTIGEEKVDILSFPTQLESPQSDFYRGRYDVFNPTLCNRKVQYVANKEKILYG